MSTTKRAWVSTVAMAVVVAILIPCTPVAAQQSYDPDEEIPTPTHTERVLTKLGRGFSNILLGWVEIPLTFDRKYKDGRPLGYLIGVVPVLGVARACMRTGAGFYEVATFPSPQETNYEAILEPDYIF